MEGIRAWVKLLGFYFYPNTVTPCENNVLSTIYFHGFDTEVTLNYEITLHNKTGIVQE